MNILARIAAAAAMATATACALLAPTGALAFVWDEASASPAAGSTLATAQVVPVEGQGPLQGIRGTLTNTVPVNGTPLFEVDLFQIRISDFRSFSAATSSANPTDDTALFLFDSLGFGVYANDDNPGDFLSTLSGTGPRANGDYFLGVALGGFEAFDAAQRSIFDAGRPVAGSGALASWASSYPTLQELPFFYDIALTGAGIAPVPEPAAWLLLALGLGVLGLRRARTAAGAARGAGMLGLLTGVALASTGLDAAAQATANARALALPGPLSGAVPPSLMKPQGGRVQAVVQLTEPSLLQAMGPNAKRSPSLNLEQRRAHMAMLRGRQDALMAEIAKLGGVELARVGKTYNALVIGAETSKLAQIARLPGVFAIKASPDARLALSDTLPYVGAKALQDLNVTGAGIRIAVLDSGIDYTHRNLGGSGSAADFAAAATDPTVLPAGLFPTAKVIGGYDFVGDTWPEGEITYDPNPIDSGSGHGTHVADIAAGASLDGLHKGVAPGAKLYAVKVCSSVSTACLGYAIMQGLEWVVDPNGDLDFADAADVVNLSLGSSYGQRESPDTAAVSSLVRFGIVVVASAGNGGERPYIVAAPSNAAEAISVAQTAMPRAEGVALVVGAPASIAGTYTNTNTVDWAPITSGFAGPLRVAGSPGSVAAQACTAADTIDFSGTVALIDRGNCNISLKVKNATGRGALGVVIANNVPGDAPSFSSGGDTPVTQTLIVTQDIGSRLRSAPAGSVRVSVGQQPGIPLVGSMASSSSLGPGYSFTALKPEIGAPGALVSALAGSGSGEAGFSGTSGSAPVVAGSAALLLQKFAGALPSEIKSRLMNSADPAIYSSPLTQPGALAPVSRIGAGEVRVSKAAAISTGIWDASNPGSVGLAFGTLRASGVTKLVKKVAVRNYTSASRAYAVVASFRDAGGAAGGAVTISAPPSITVAGNAMNSFTLTLTVDAAKLPPWPLGAPGVQGTGRLLQDVEFDGYVTVSDSAGSAAVPWHFLPHKSANVTPAATSVALGGGSAATLGFSNAGGAATGTTEVFALTGRSASLGAEQPAYGGNYAVVDLKAVGVRPVDIGGGPMSGVQFAIATYGERALPTYPAEFNVYIDSNNDGIADHALFNAESGGFGASGQSLVYAVQISAGGTPVGTPVAKYYADADLNSSNIVFTVAAADIGLVAPTQRFNFSVRAFDNLYSGFQTDAVENMAYMLGSPKYGVDAASFDLAPGAARTLTVTKLPRSSSPSQSGLLLLHRHAKTGRESDAISVAP